MKTYAECCHDVAVKYGLGKTLVAGHLPKYFSEAAEMYADQFKIVIDALSKKRPMEWTTVSYPERAVSHIERSISKNHD